MTFDDGGGGPEVTLELTGGPSGHVRATLVVRGVKRVADVPTSQIEALASWIEGVWDDAPPLGLPALGLELRFSHREHVGEVYYDVHVDRAFVRSVYEQSGGSNVFRAARLREELAAARR